MPDQILVCLGCGTPLSAEDRFCKMCGKPAPAPPPPPPPAARSCPACGAALTELARFCPVCGQPVTSERTCARCGTALSPAALFCPACGQPAAAAAGPVPLAAGSASPPAAPGVAVSPTKSRSWPLVAAGLVAFLCLCGAAVSMGGLAWFWGQQTTQAEFTLGPVQMYEVAQAADTRITDSVTGQTFRFPEGGTGNMHIARIESGPAAPFAGEGVHVDYQGATPVQLMLKDTGDGTETVVLGYGHIPGSFPGRRWVALPEDASLDGYRVFNLLLPFDLAEASQPGGSLLASAGPVFGLAELAQQPQDAKKVGFSDYWIARIPARPEETDINVAIGLQISEDIDQAIAAMPADLQERAKAERQRLGLVNHDPRLGPNDEPYYTGFWYFTPWKYRPHPTIHLSSRVPQAQLADMIAHETGHHITHLLVGDETYVTLEKQSPLLFHTQHGIGDVWGSRTEFFLEEPAYFTEYFFTGGSQGGTVGQTKLTPDAVLDRLAMDPATGRARLPEAVDYPTLEGFGFSLLAALVRDKAEIYVLGGGRNKTDFPVVGLSPGQVFEIISHGATDVNQLRDHIETYLQAQGQAEKLPALAQRLGWRYKVEGRLSDGGNEPGYQYTIESISRVGCQDYKGGVSQPTGQDGKFALDQVFPGDSILRATGPVLADGKTQSKFDIPIKIDWDQPTNQPITLGDQKFARMQLLFNDTPVDAETIIKSLPGQARIKATASGIPPSIKSLRWKFEIASSAPYQEKEFFKDSGVQATETQGIEAVMPADDDDRANEIDFAVRVYLQDMTCGQQTFDMGVISVNVTGEAVLTEGEAPAEAQPQATPTEEEAAAEAQPGAAPPEEEAPAETEGGGCWVQVGQRPGEIKLENDDSNTYTFTGAEGSVVGVRDWARAGCQGQVSSRVTWTPLPATLVPGQVVSIDMAASISGSEVCDPRYDLWRPQVKAWAVFRPKGNGVADAEVAYPDGPFEKQANYQWTVPDGWTDATLNPDFHITTPAGGFTFYNYDYEWRETGDCAAPAGPPAATEEEFFRVWSTGVANNGATSPTTFSIDQPWQVTEILTYHWNEGQGMPPGTIGLSAADGTMYGPWPAAAREGSDVANTDWVVQPNIIIPPGDYTVIDSDPATWSQNEETGGAGMGLGKGIRQNSQ